MNKHLKKISEEILGENPWWKYKRDVYEKPNGEPGDFFYGETPGFSMVVPVLEDGRLVLIRQYRYLEDKECIGFPGGGIKSNQTPLDTAKAELLEETGCLAHEFVKIGMFQPSPGFVKDQVHIFLAEVDEMRHQELDDTEQIEILLRRPDEVDEMVHKNEIWDGQTMAAWAMVHHEFLHK
ncbi:MAG: hypothetical protein US42_C0011G0030 [Candidatus Magasanikbacteria bacterium GW2011_GWC2_37_14]|uniref:Nudix hydrolase domain-containing protein n=1 Tax=Candidatus Magasanikbacteria bacterium GW2011_GWC2_37_14 TaxID=1619046 RepID=A0A0G0GBF4_9BACT|nr:MAG: hypothetical protein US42_C0011G0030 [Candidatus Magasanikbacteria bacterium GW2011_GWC2_37_14]